MFKENHSDSARSTPTFKYPLEQGFVDKHSQTSIEEISREEINVGESCLIPQDTIHTIAVPEDTILLSLGYCQQSENTFLYSRTPIFDLSNFSYAIARDLCEEFDHDSFNEGMDELHSLLESLHESYSETPDSQWVF
jgi:hypothetical protein